MFAKGEIRRDVGRRSVFILSPRWNLSYKCCIEVCVATQHHEGIDVAIIPEFYISLQVVADHQEFRKWLVPQVRMLPFNYLENLRVWLAH